LKGGGDSLNQLQHPLAFVHKFNLYKLSGLLIEDDDLSSIARVYGVSLEELKGIEEQFLLHVAELSAALVVESRPAADPVNDGTPSVSILAIGDSITSDRESYVKILNHYWRRDPSRQMLDAAISGDTTADLVKRFYSSVLNREFQWAVLFIGTNDSLQLDDEMRISVLSLDEYMRNIRFITETLISKGKRLIQITIPPVDNARMRSFFPDANSVYTKEQIGEVNAFIREWAGKNNYPVADLARAIERQEEDVLEPDGLHLNGRGQRMICELLLEHLP
jgi:lysophospholipase L1-like esterase